MLISKDKPFIAPNNLHVNLRETQIINILKFRSFYEINNTVKFIPPVVNIRDL